MALTIPAPHPVHTMPETAALAVSPLELAALNEGRALAGSRAADVLPLHEARAHCCGQCALFHALDALAAGGSR